MSIRAEITPIQHQLCSVTLLGNLVKKPSIRYMANPVLAITELTLATNSRWLDKKTNQFKEWTSYHHIKVVGSLVDQHLLHVDKGDVILVHGQLINIANTSTAPNMASQQTMPTEMVNATFIKPYAKGYSQSINKIHCSGTITSPIQLMKTEYNKDFIEVKISINYQEYSSIQEKVISHSIERLVHIWGKQAVKLSEQAKIGDELVVEGKLSNLKGSNPLQFIEAKNAHWFETNT
jgi:single-strand DNA-binding protein